MTIAVVTGASRGVGRGIALALGDSGATVYVTGRSTAGIGPADGAPGTIDETAALVTARGGTGIPVRCDHTDDAQIAELFARVRSEQSHADLLVNCAWGGYETYDHAHFTDPFWEAPFASRWHTMFTAGVRATMATTHAAIPALLPSAHGLIINIAAWDRGRYLGALVYDAAKASIVRFTATLAHELRSHSVAAVALFPGFTSTERVRMAGAAGLESPEYTGRGVAALAGDPDVMRHTGSGWRIGDLAREYGITDIDGSQPEPFALPDELELR